MSFDTGVYDAAFIASAKKAQTLKETLLALGANIAKSKTRERLPSAFQTLHNEAVKNSAVETLYIKAEDFNQVFMQQGLTAEQIAQAANKIGAKNYMEAAQTDGDIVFDGAKLIEAFAATKDFEVLTNYIRNNPEDLSAADIKRITESLNKISAENEKLLQDSGIGKGNEEYERIYEKISKEMAAVAPPKYNKKQWDKVSRETAALLTPAIITTALRQGKPIQETADRLIPNFISNAAKAKTEKEIITEMLTAQGSVGEGKFLQPLVNGIDLKQNIPVLTISENTLKSKDDLKQYLQNLIGKQLETQDKSILNFVDKVKREGKKSIKVANHIFYSAFPRQAQQERQIVLSNLEDVIRNSVLIDIEDAKQDKTDYDKAYRFYAAVKMKDGIYPVRITALHNKSNENIRTEADVYDVILENKKRAAATATERSEADLPAEENIATGKTAENQEQAPVTATERSVANLPALDESIIQEAESEKQIRDGITLQELLSGIKDSQGNFYFQRAWHGTGVKGITEFSNDKIGSGEGAQAFGWGLYFSSLKSIAQWYRKKLSRASFEIDGQEVEADRDPILPVFEDFAKWDNIYTPMDLANLLQQYGRKGAISYLETLKKQNPHEIDTINNIDRGIKLIKEATIYENTGQLYEVEIPESKDFLQWDKPFSEQASLIQANLIHIGNALGQEIKEDLKEAEKSDFLKGKGQDIYFRIGKLSINKLKDKEMVKKWRQQGDENTAVMRAATLVLSNYNIVGNEYPSDSLGGISGSKGRNFVLFDPKYIEIKKTYYQSGIDERLQSENFKKWFGDWEKAKQIIENNKKGITVPLSEAIDFALNGKPVVSLTGNEFQKDSIPLSKKVEDFYNGYFNGQVATQKGNVLLTKRGINADISHGIGKEKSAAFAAVPDILSKGKVFDFTENYKNRGQDRYVFTAPILFNNKNYIGEVVVVSDKNGKELYLHEVEIKERLENALTGFQDKAYPTSRLILSHNLDILNNASKVVDDSGKPLVVYHSLPYKEGDGHWDENGEKFVKTPPPFSIFDAKKSKWNGLIFFGKDRNRTEGFAADKGMNADYTENTYTFPVFLNMKKPFYGSKADIDEIAKYLPDTITVVDYYVGNAGKISKEEYLKQFEESKDWTLYESPEIVKAVKEAGFDGIISRESGDATFAVFEPSQIKSINNSGSFEAQNPDIYKQGNRAMLELTSEGKPLVTLFEDADASSVIHEFGHIWLNEGLRFLEEYEAAGGSEAYLKEQGIERQYIKDLIFLRKHLGIEAGAEITRQQHEVFARSFEAYLFEGKAPTMELRRVFENFRRWLLKIYRTVLSLEAPLNDEIRGVFDRMLATEEEIEIAESMKDYAKFGEEVLDEPDKKRLETITETAKMKAFEIMLKEQMSKYGVKEISKMKKMRQEAIKKGIDNFAKEAIYSAQKSIEETFKSPAKEIAQKYRDRMTELDEAKGNDIKRWYQSDSGLAERIKKLESRDSKKYQPHNKLSKKEVEGVFRQAGEVSQEKIGKTRFPIESAGKILRQQGFDTSTIIKYLPELYENSILLNSIPEKEYQQQHKKHDNIALWHNTLNKFKIGNDEFYIRFTVTEGNPGRQKKGGEKFLHSTFVSDIKLYKAENEKDAVWRDTGLLTRAPQTTSIDGILKEILDEVNGGKRFQGGKDKTETLSERDRYIFDEIAQYYGYSSGDAMAQAIIDNPSLQEAAEQWADKYMEQNYGARESAESIQRKAVEAIFNEKNLERIALEYQIIFKMMTRSADFSGLESIKINRSEIDLYKRYAAQTLAGKSVKESTNYRIYLTAERRMAQRSQRGIDNKDFVEASRAKRLQLINAALAREAMRNRVEIEKKIKRFESFLRQKKVSAAYGDIRHLYILLEKAGINTKGENSELITIANQMLKEGAKEWEIRNNTGYIADEDGNLHKESLKEFANRMEDDYTPLLIADNIMDGSAIKPYKEMLLEDFRNLADAFESIKTAGHNRNRFINEARQQTISQAAAETADSIVKNAGVKFEDDKLIGHKNTTMAAGIFNRLKELPDRFLDSLANLPTICKILDGGAVNGAAMRNIYRPLQEANRREKERHIKIQKDIQALLAKHYPNNEIAKYKSQRYKIYIKRIDRNLYMEEILAMALNFGNEQNISRMHNFETIVDGDLLKLDAGDIHECLEHLKKNDWEFVQGVWDYLDSFWAEIASLERSVNGFIPKRVEPSPFSVKTADGHIVKMRGGYYPISYDPQKSIEADRHNEMKNALFKQFSTAAAQTEQGHTKARVRNVNRAIKLDTSVLFNHLDNVVHDLEFRKAVIDTNKFLNQNEVKEAISDALGIRGYRMIRETLKATASEQGETLSDFQRPVNWLRQKTVLYYLGYRLAALPRDMAGNIAIAMHEQGAGGWISGMLSFAKDWRQNIGIVDEKSVMMKNRRLLKDRDFWEMSKKIFISSNFAKVRNEFTQKAFMFQAWADTMHAYPLWLQTYKEALVKIKQDGRLIEEFGLGKTEAEKEPLPDIDYGTDLNTGESAAPAKQEMPQDDFYQNPEGDFRLPDLNSADLDLMKKENKPVILKKNIVERNDKKHSDIRGQENKIISEALYKPDLILQDRKNEKPNYYTFVKINDDSSIVLLEMSEEKDNFEVAHYYKVNEKGLEKILNRTRQEDGYSLITNRINPKWAANLSALLPGNENIAKKVEEYVERMAVLAADEAVIRTFGGGSAVDLAQIQRGGEYQKLFTMFYSFAGAMYNRFYYSAYCKDSDRKCCNF